MNVQVLASVMHQNNMDIVRKMNIETEAIIINQCNKNDYDEMTINNKKIKMYSFKERGVGLSRNNALMRATEDILVFADEDENFIHDYEKVIVTEFEKYKDADMIMFNVPSTNPDRPIYNINKNKRVKWYNCLRYGAVKMAIKKEAVQKCNLYFSLLFGGGAKYMGGEDSLFVKQAIKKGLKVYANKNVIGYVSQEDSTWFKNGHDEKYFKDRGALFANLYPRMSIIFILQLLIRHRNLYSQIGFKNAFKFMLEGKKEFERR